MVLPCLNKKFLQYTLLFLGLTFSTGLFAANNPIQQQCDSLIASGRKELDVRNYLKALELSKEALQIAKKNSWQEQIYTANKNIGSAYLAMLNYGDALDYYLTAYKIALKENWPTKEVQILNNIAVLYSKEKKLDRALEYFTKAYKLSKKENDSVTIAGYSLNVALVLTNMNKVDEARKYLDEALGYAKNDPEFTDNLQGAVAENEMLKGHSAKARQMSLALLDKIKGQKNKTETVTLQLIIAKACLQENDYATALRYTQMALKNNKDDIETKKAIYTIFSEIYTKSGALLEALRCKDSVFALQEKISDIKNGKAYEETRVKFEMQEYQNKIDINEATIASERKMFYSVLLALLAVLLLIFFVLRNLAIKQKQKKLIAENSHQMLALELEKKKSEALLQEKLFREQQTETLLEQERLKNEIEYKNRKLSSKALYMSGKDQLIEEFVGLLSDQPEVARIPAVRNHIRHLKNTLKPDNEWESFLRHFEEVNQGFLSHLRQKHPDLTANDIRFICYVYMNLSAKEMATMLNISLDACRKRKERVALKLGLPDATALYGYLSGI
ncbi:tetratricopeptide repeat protein [Flavobacterium subsaxonicum]|uniref:Tetratricopeptide repeat protein n=1 Tax=Flavobacterium subsaxonicum WB 4.1-42 = DSM 21790 TaxID=1121898 RepID=A0A0A2MK85_9FLAO|nr:tetratricopeptide repeat protein [Flavobacterium subsaxonicum]KGO92669.1 hypothetical protein Q766_11135 [Flavobacterium subsaxonicum WB 4.1-42 = DSM 21790]